MDQQNMGMDCEETAHLDGQAARKPELIEELTKQITMKATKAARMQRAELNFVDMVAERPGQAQSSFPDMDNKPNNNNVVCVEQKSRSFQRAALAAGAVGLGLFFVYLHASSNCQWRPFSHVTAKSLAHSTTWMRRIVTKGVGIYPEVEAPMGKSQPGKGPIACSIPLTSIHFSVTLKTNNFA